MAPAGVVVLCAEAGLLATAVPVPEGRGVLP